MKNILLTSMTLALFLGNGVFSPAEAEQISLQSDNKKLEESFQWAVKKAHTFKMTGKTSETNVEGKNHLLGYKASVKCIPSYWAGYAHRSAFYVRDFAHQSLGAELVGMNEENFSMYEVFARHCTEDKKWNTWWALNFDGSVYTLDAPNPPGEEAYLGYPEDFKNPKGEVFVREVPANFDLIANSYKCYLWSGDERYISSPHLRQMRERVMSDYIRLHDTDNNAIPEGVGDIWIGTSSYNERDLHPRESADTISLLYSARLAYVGFLEMEGQKEKAAEEKKKAQSLYRYFNDKWSRALGDGIPVCAVGMDGTPSNKFAAETTFLMPLFGVLEPGERNDLLLKHIKEQVGDGLHSKNPGPKSMQNIESYTYLPPLFFDYNKVNEAYSILNYIIDQIHQTHEVAAQGTNGDYPEVSFTLVSSIVEGMMGIQANAPRFTIGSVPRLPNDTGFATIKNLKLGNHEFEMKHTKNQASELTYTKGKNEFTWEASFYGKHPVIKVNGKETNALSGEINGVPVSTVKIKMKEGMKVKAEL